MRSCPTLVKSAVLPKTTCLCCSITVITLWSDHTVTKIIWIFSNKPWHCHGWSRCNGICLVSGPQIYCTVCDQKPSIQYTVAPALVVRGSVPKYLRRFRLFLRHFVLRIASVCVTAYTDHLNIFFSMHDLHDFLTYSHACITTNTLFWFAFNLLVYRTGHALRVWHRVIAKAPHV